MTPAIRKTPAKTKTRKRPPAKPPRPFVKHRPNTSATCMYPYECASELLLPESSIYPLMAVPVEQGGLRCMSLGDPRSSRPRKVVHRADFALYVEFKRGLCTLAEYVKRAGRNAQG